MSGFLGFHRFLPFNCKLRSGRKKGREEGRRARLAVAVDSELKA